jgi:NTP pyrophosphatase (non-canonical NTP hydrolase)
VFNLTVYQKLARVTAVYPKELSKIYPTIALAGEVGEVANLVKKELRSGSDHSEKIKEELGDVLWYVANLAYDYGFDLSEIARENLAKLSERKVEGTLSER